MDEEVTSHDHIYLILDEKLLFEGFGWAVIAAATSETNEVYASHQQCTLEYKGEANPMHTGGNERVYGEGTWSLRNKEVVCIDCGDPVPDEIQGLCWLYKAR